MDMITKDPTSVFNYYERITCSRQWKEFNRALAAELIVGLPAEENRKLFSRIGERIAQSLPVARCNTLAELQEAFNARWESIGWGFGALAETADHVEIVHACSPMAMAFGPDTSDWASGFFEGAYQTWFAAQGIPPGLRVQARSAPDEPDSARAPDTFAGSRQVHLKLGRFPS